MADEAVVRIVLEDGGTTSQPAPARATPAPSSPPPAPAPPAPATVAPPAGPSQKDLYKAFRYGEASPYAPPGKPIQAPQVEGLSADKAEFLRLEAEAARRGMSVKDYKRAEVEGRTTVAEAPAPAPAAPEPAQVQPPPPPLPPAEPFGPPEPDHDAEFERRRQERLAAAERRRQAEEDEVRRREMEQGITYPDQPSGLVLPAPATVPAPEEDSDEEFERRRAQRQADRERRDRERDAEIALLDPFRGVAPEPPPEPAVVAPTEPAERPPPVQSPTTPGFPEGHVPSDEPWRPPIPFVSTEEAAAKQAAQDAALSSVQDSKATALQSTAAAAEAPPAFDQVALAKKRIEREEQRAAVDAEYAKLKPPPPPIPEPPFDPVKLAKQRVEAEEKRRAVDAEYAKLKPKSAFDNLMDAAESIRGTLGGTFGRTVGAALDITARLRKMREQRGEPAPAEAPAGKADIPQAKPVDKPVPAAPMAALVPTPKGGDDGARDKPAAKAEVPATKAGDGEGGGGGGGGGSKLATAAQWVAIGSIIAGAIKGAMGTFTRASDRYGEYNYVIAQQQAMAEIRMTLGDIRRAREGSKELADFVKAQSEMQNKWEDVKMALMRKIVPVLTGILEVLGQLLGIVTQTDAKEIQDPTTVLLNGPGPEMPDL